MTTGKTHHVVSLSAELSRPDDDLRRRAAQRWNATLQRLCLLRATRNETSYEVEWAQIFEVPRLFDDLRQPSKLVALAALEVLEVQHEHGLMVCEAEGLEYDDNVASEFRELLAAMRIKVERGLP